MFTIEKAKECIATEFIEFNKQFDECFVSDNSLLHAVNSYILQKKGKQIRPIVTLLVAKALGGITDQTIKSAIAIEMLHTASLIHDDVVDDADSRRGQKSVNAVWKNKISILVGDFLLSKSINTANETNIFEIVKAIGKVGIELSEGELLEMDLADKCVIDEEKYYEVIKNKTAVLFSTACRIASYSIGANNSDVDKMVKFGEIFGLCFQIRDDIFDYISTKNKIGKPVGNDIAEGKITLPMIYALGKDKRKAEPMLKIINSKDYTEENIKKLIDFATAEGGIEYAESKLSELLEKGKKTLEGLGDSEAKTTLINLLEFTAKREN